VLADEVHLQRLVGAGGQEGGLGQQLDLQRQQVAEDAGQRDHDVDARAAERLERNQLRPGERP
jgi:Mn-dependent DtxR family transcriptional regulator